MKKSKVSITDIASQLKISTTTVSFILNGKAKEKRISEELTERVLKLVEKVGYRPNHFAQTLRTGKTNIIGLMVEDISDPFFASLAKHIEDVALKRGYKILYCSTENGKKRAQEFLRMFDQLGVDGYIVTPPAGIEDDLSALIANGKEIILFDRYFKKVAADYVITDNAESAYNGVEHLVKQGYKKIAFITLATRQPQMTGRLSGYERAMRKYDLPAVVHKLAYSANRAEYIEKITDIVKQDSSIDAILFSTGSLGLGGVEALTHLDINIPNQIGVVSYDDPDLFRINRPSITAIAQPIEQLAQALITRLLNKIAEPSKKAGKEQQETVIPATLIPRESSRKTT
jgi:LacI family transcriptional regulator